jgi:hypothetical protein
MTETTAPAATVKDLIACECSKYDVLVNVRDTEDGDLTWDAEFTTGCTATTRNTFAPGHDAKLKSFLIKMATINGADIRRTEGGMSVSADAQTHANRYDFGYMVANGIATATEKAAAKAAKAAKREEARIQREIARDAKKAKNTPTPAEEPEVIAKVGRWEYKGIEKDGTFYYLAKDGHTRKETTKYEVLRTV